MSQINGETWCPICHTGQKIIENKIVDHHYPTIKRKESFSPLLSELFCIGLDDGTSKIVKISIRCEGSGALVQLAP